VHRLPRAQNFVDLLNLQRYNGTPNLDVFTKKNALDDFVQQALLAMSQV